MVALGYSNHIPIHAVSLLREKDSDFTGLQKHGAMTAAELVEVINC